jgi:hypothetical protein
MGNNLFKKIDENSCFPEKYNSTYWYYSYSKNHNVFQPQFFRYCITKNEKVY